MANALNFDLVSPEQRLAQLQVTEVQIPGADGDMTAMADHSPTITTLRPGLLKVTHVGGTDEYVVSGGFAEITPEAVSVLAEQALPKADVTQDQFSKLIADATSARDAAQEAGHGVDETAKLLADLMAVGSEIGLSAG